MLRGLSTVSPGVLVMLVTSGLFFGRAFSLRENWTAEERQDMVAFVLAAGLSHLVVAEA
ncbi:MAG: hypothetical protein WAM04_08845 [Candidatus Sulfotelmatobacter sp.]